MAGEPPQDPPPDAPSQETRLLRAEVAQQKSDAQTREVHEAGAEELKNRVSIAAIILTTALSFIGNVKGDRAGAASGMSAAASEARRQGADLWAYYQSKLSERTALELARDRIRLDLSKRGLVRTDPEARLDTFRLTGYEERIRDFDTETERVFYRVQDLERQDEVSQRAASEPLRAVVRYELGSKLITLALILLSVTILSNRRYLLWAGVALGSVGLAVALDAYVLFL
jgi:hypothetical protein